MLAEWLPAMAQPTLVTIQARAIERTAKVRSMRFIG